jgi:RNA polymerase sigma-70 factor (ECF subfamily)
VEDRARSDAPAERALDSEAQWLQQIRSGDTEAGHRFVQEQYPAVYRYLLALTRRADQAEDLTQETFLQAWRHLDTFAGRAPLRSWLCSIARREFLQALRCRRDVASLEEVGEVAASGWTEAVDLRQIVDRLPLAEREVLLLHDLEGYTSREIAPIVGVPASTVRRRLVQARQRLRQELGEDDLLYLNEPLAPMRQWAWLPLEQMHALETRLTPWKTGDREEHAMERREFLRQAAVGAAGLMLPEAEKEVVDSRLTQKVTLALKGTALSDVCERLRADTGLHLFAGNSVADEKVTVFCEKMPLRDVMRQLSRPFGYTWLRSGQRSTLDAGRSTATDPTGPSVERPASSVAYRYELVQDLRSQLLEEELRNRDRNTALLAFDRDVERYRPYLGLLPNEALSRSESAPPAEKELLKRFAGFAWGPLQVYFRLSPQEMQALRAGKTLKYSTSPSSRGELPLSRDLRDGVLQSQRDRHLIPATNALIEDLTDPRGLPLAAVPHAQAMVQLRLTQSELGQFALGGGPGVYCVDPIQYTFTGNSPYAVGSSPATLNPDNAVANAKLAREQALRSHIAVALAATPPTVNDQRPAPAPPSPDSQSSTLSRKVTTADVLEALHRATGLPIVADFYTRLFEPRDVSVQDLPVFDALNRLADRMRLRWNKDGDWLQFRSSSFYHDRLKEVPNRLLTRWAASRKRHGHLTLDDLVEISQLPDTQLDGTEMAEGARELWGLAEWDQACYRGLRPHLRYLATFTPEQRERVQSATGLPFVEMTLAQQQQFIAFAFLDRSEPLRSLEELAGATLRVDYSLPGWFQWGNPDAVHYTTWAVLLDADRGGRRVPRPPVRERSKEAALQAARRLDPRIRASILEALRQSDPRAVPTPQVDISEIYPMRLRLSFIYIPGAMSPRGIHIWFDDSDIGPRF